MVGENLRIRIPFLRSFQTISLPRKNVHSVLYPNKVRIRNEAKNIKASLENPVNYESFERFLQDHETFVIVVNDRTRPTPTSRILDTVLPYVGKKETQILVATGSHRAPTEAEYREILGKHYSSFRSRTSHHDDKDSQNLVHLCRSDLGYDVYINELVTRADGVITIGSVEPHYFAGFTGGRKSLVPGVVGHRSTEQNHYHALKKEACPLKLKGNPVHEDLENVTQKISNEMDIFAINVVTDRNNRIYSCASGHIIDSFYRLVKPAEDVYSVIIKEKADVVVTVARPPLDIDLYQSQKAIENTKKAVRDKGIIILVSGCYEGIGPRAFFDLLSMSSTPEEVFNKIREGYKLGYHKAAKIAETVMIGGLWGVTGLSPEVLRKALIKPFANVQTAINSALEDRGSDATVLFVMDGGMMVPTTGIDD